MLHRNKLGIFVVILSLCATFAWAQATQDQAPQEVVVPRDAPTEPTPAPAQQPSQPSQGQPDEVQPPASRPANHPGNTVQVPAQPSQGINPSSENNGVYTFR